MWHTRDNGSSFNLDKAHALIVEEDGSGTTFGVIAYFSGGEYWGLADGLATLQDAKDLIASLVSPTP
jgi:hypothetical protein